MDLAPSRDYVFISDAIAGILQSTRAEPGSIFNIGSGEAHSVEQVIQLACAVAGIDKPYAGLSRSRRNEIDSTVADTRKLRDAVGWRPRVSLESGLRQIVESMRTQCRA
jgi:nucleoside-diphosphate-sugar epimerase